MEIKVERLTPANQKDFFAFHTAVGGECFCTAWWVPTWAEWSERTADQNRALREELLQRGEYDGYLLYVDGVVAGWCQVGKRDRLGKLVGQFSFEPEPEIWSITCFQISPEKRRQGLAEQLLRAVLLELIKRGAKQVQAYPKIDADLPDGSQWTGPRGLYEKVGFIKHGDNKTRAVFQINFQD
jgi:ribosomal protein S18 acetylase RimI-like enzyme